MHARKAIIEMYRQVGDLLLDDTGVAQRGLIIRHLVLPSKLSGSRESLTWLANEVSHKVYVSVMSQYFPAHYAAQIPHLDRTISLAEYTEVTKLLAELDIKNGWVQSMGAEERYLPDFGAEAGPFLSVTERRK
jgi:putative pyruvate formate lyase activating enzyme